MKFFRTFDESLIYPITKGETTPANFADKKKKILKLIETAADLRIPLIQIREKLLSAKLLFELTAAAAQITKKTETRLLVNDRADIAFAANADGVHLTSASLSADVIRRVFPQDFIVGVSAHSLAEVQKAKLQKADFAVFSPIFSTPNKGEPVGLRKLREVFERVKPFPVLGLGGINETNYESVLEIADGFAAIRFLNDTENLRKLMKGVNLAKKN
ncbi:MAG TPA: thiamine phosphate synthase [Pyrinomonadaceae bacterium]